MPAIPAKAISTLLAGRHGGYTALDRIRLMARKLRIQYPGAIYHVMNRGDLPSSDYGKARLAGSHLRQRRGPGAVAGDVDRSVSEDRLAVTNDQSLLGI